MPSYTSKARRLARLIGSNGGTSRKVTGDSAEFDATVTATHFIGDGSSLTNIDYSVSQSDVTAHQAALSVTESQISDLGSYITDYTVTQGDVTAHQAALSITESQISDLGTYVATSGDQTIAGTKTFTGVILSGTSGGGQVALTTNDGGGNANVTFNHVNNAPDASGLNAGRITVNTDASTNGSMAFEVGTAVTGAMAQTHIMYATGDFHADGDVIAYSTTTSDARLKDNVTTIENGLDKVCAMRGVEFDWNATSRKGQHDIGVIAQEMEAVIPEIVREKTLCTGEYSDGNEFTVKTVDYEKLVGVLIEAVKELKAEIDELKSV